VYEFITTRDSDNNFQFASSSNNRMQNDSSSCADDTPGHTQDKQKISAIRSQQIKLLEMCKHAVF